MSLHRVASIETLADPSVRRGSNSGHRPRKLSFSPIPQSWDPPQPVLNKTSSGHDHFYDNASQNQAEQHREAVEPVSAFEVPTWKRILQIAVAVLYCLLAAGVVFGYAAIKPVLKDEGAYRDYCPDGKEGDTCVEIHLNLMFTVAAVGTNVAALPVGAVLDHFGPRVCGIIGSICLTVGALILAYAQDLPFDAFLLGYLMLALGGPFIFVSSFQLSNAFPRHSGLVLALLTGAFDSSSAIFLLYRVIYNSTGGRFGHRPFFLLYLVVPILIFVLQFVLMPATSYKTVGELVGLADETQAAVHEPTTPDMLDDQVDEETALLRDERREQQREREAVMADIESLLGSIKGDQQLEAEERKNVTSGVWGVLHDNTVLQQISSPWFILICLFTIVQMTRINYFVATIRPQYEAILGDADKAVTINNFFDIALPVGGICAIPFIGVILDHTSTTTVLSVLVSVATAIGILGVLPYMWAAYANIILFVLYRPFYYTAVSDYSAKVFGFRTFGTVYGLVICLSGLLNLSQSGLDFMVYGTFKGNPIPVDIMLLGLGLVIGLILVVYVAIQVRKRNNQAGA